MEHQLPQVPQAKQVEVAEEDSRPQGEGFVFLQIRVEQVQVALTGAADKCHKKRHDIPYTFIIILESVFYQVNATD